MWNAHKVDWTVIGLVVMLGVGGVLGTSSALAAPGQVAMFRVRIDNISQGNVLQLASGGAAPFVLSPGVWLVHTEPAQIFKSGEHDRGEGLEAQAEDGNPLLLRESLRKHSHVESVGIFNIPVGASGPGPIVPGGAYEFEISAMPYGRLTIVTMFGQSNDLFYAPQEAGIALFDKNGQPIKGDVTRDLVLWDAGTEVNQEPGAGPDQAPRQKAPNSGADEHSVVRAVKDPYTYPKTAAVLRVTITPAMSATAHKY